MLLNVLNHKKCEMNTETIIYTFIFPTLAENRVKNAKKQFKYMFCT